MHTSNPRLVQGGWTTWPAPMPRASTPWTEFVLPKMRAPNKIFSQDVLRISIRQLLAALDFLHREALIVPTGDYGPQSIDKVIVAD